MGVGPENGLKRSMAAQLQTQMLLVPWLPEAAGHRMVPLLLAESGHLWQLSICMHQGIVLGSLRLVMTNASRRRHV